MSARTLGVVGTLVWDRFDGPREREGPVEGWGGIAYSLAALAASLPESWSVRPIVKVGRDLVDAAHAFLAELPRIDASAIAVVPEANNRVELRYESATRRRERLTGGVPPWRWDEMAPAVAGCDALHVNFISGFEMELGDARSLADGFGGPIYADLHSLFLAKDERGLRMPRALPEAAEWLRCFEAVQLNRDELDLLLGGDGGWRRAAALLASGPRLVAVTLGEEGAAAVTRLGLDPDPTTWRGAGPAPSSATEHVRASTEPVVGDPTGCGDVWGAALFARLLAGDSLSAALEEANRLGGLNVGHRGAGGLAEHLAGSVAAGVRTSRA